MKVGPSRIGWQAVQGVRESAGGIYAADFFFLMDRKWLPKLQASHLPAVVFKGRKQRDSLASERGCACSHVPLSSH